MISVSLEGDGEGNHAIGSRDGKMHVPDPILVSQLYASAVVTDVYLRKSNDDTAIARAIKRQTSKTSVQLGIEQVYAKR